MKGALQQLTFKGSEDINLNIDPEFSYFKKVYKRHSNFSMESIEHNITGLYHVTNNTAISKHDLLQLFKKYTNKKINIEPSAAKVNDKSFIDTRLLLNYKIPSYDEMIFDMVELIKNNELYNQYKF